MATRDRNADPGHGRPRPSRKTPTGCRSRPIHPGEERALTQAVIALTQAGKRRQAAAIARRVAAIARHVISPEDQVNLARSYAAVAQAWTHRRAAALAAQAENLARSIGDEETRENALPLVAGALAHTGQHKQAENLAYSITNPVCKAGALAQIAGALAHAGQHKQAEKLAHSITGTYHQAEDMLKLHQVDALAQIAAAYARAGDPRSAKRVAAEACVAGNWAVAVMPVLHLTPSSLTAVNRILRDSSTVDSRSACGAPLRNRTVGLLLTIGFLSALQPGVSAKGQVRGSASARLGQVQGGSRRMRPPRFLPAGARGGAHARPRFHAIRYLFDSRRRVARALLPSSPRRAQRRGPPAGRRRLARICGHDVACIFGAGGAWLGNGHRGRRTGAGR